MSPFVMDVFSYQVLALRRLLLFSQPDKPRMPQVTSGADNYNGY
jgi:hypothetical protein